LNCGGGLYSTPAKGRTSLDIPESWLRKAEISPEVSPRDSKCPEDQISRVKLAEVNKTVRANKTLTKARAKCNESLSKLLLWSGGNQFITFGLKRHQWDSKPRRRIKKLQVEDHVQVGYRKSLFVDVIGYLN
jgi:hypothetical protein